MCTLFRRTSGHVFIPGNGSSWMLAQRTRMRSRKMGLAPGDPVAPDAPFTVMNGTQNYLGKAWDDRVGCAVVIEAMRRLSNAPHPNQIFWVATVQEEIGLRGAHTAADA